MAINKFRNHAATVPYSEKRQEVDILRSVNLHAIRLRISGTLDVAGGAANGTVLTDPVARLLKSVVFKWDGMEVVNLRGSDLAEITRRIGKQNISPQVPADGAIQAATALRHDLIIPLARPYLLNPIETVFPSVRVRQQLKLFLEFERDKSTAGSDPGTAALIDTDGDRTVTLTDVEVDVSEVYSTGVFKPFYIPVLRVESSDPFNAAASAHPLRLRGERRFDSVLLRPIEDDVEEPASLITELTLVGGVNRFIDAMKFEDMKAEEVELFGAVPEAGSSLMVAFADNGKLGNVVNPNDFTDPRFEFNVSAPATNPGQIRAIMFELAAVPGVTRITK